MNQTLSIVLPVRNVEAMLGRRVQELLEAATELTPTFEMIIVDDASTDLTEEVAYELSRRYPQVRLCHQRTPQGRAASVAAGKAIAEYEIVLAPETDDFLTAAELRRLWDNRRADLTVSPGPSSINSHLMNRLTAWGEALRHSAHQPREVREPRTSRREGRGATS